MPAGNISEQGAHTSNRAALAYNGSLRKLETSHIISWKIAEEVAPHMGNTPHFPLQVATCLWAGKGMPPFGKPCLPFSLQHKQGISRKHPPHRLCHHDKPSANPTPLQHTIYKYIAGSIGFPTLPALFLRRRGAFTIPSMKSSSISRTSPKDSANHRDSLPAFPAAAFAVAHTSVRPQAVHFGLRAVQT